MLNLYFLKTEIEYRFFVIKDKFECLIKLILVKTLKSYIFTQDILILFIVKLADSRHLQQKLSSLIKCIFSFKNQFIRPRRQKPGSICERLHGTVCSIP